MPEPAETLGLEPAGAEPADGAEPASLEPAAGFAEIAVDAPGGAGIRPLTYAIPRRLAGLSVGEAVLVDLGKRRAIGVVMALVGAPAFEARPIVDRVRSDGPLLPPLAIALVGSIASTYLAPPMAVVRSMLPPEHLERLELVAELVPEAESAAAVGPDAEILDALADGPLPVHDLEALVARGGESRADLMRRLRALALARRIRLDWTLESEATGPKMERWVLLAPGEAAEAGTGKKARALGPRQVAALEELRGSGGEMAAPVVAAHHGSGTVASLLKRGLVRVEMRERPRDPLAERAPAPRGVRPETSELTEPQAEAVAEIARAIEARDSRPLLLRGVTGAGKTAIYVDAIRASLAAGRPALVLVPEIALALPLVDRLRAELDARVALLHSGLSDGERADEWRAIRAGNVEVVVGTRLAAHPPLADVGVVIVDEEHDGSYKADRTPRLQARDVAIELGRLAGAAVVLGSATPAVETIGRVRSGEWREVVLPSRPSGTLPSVEVVDLRAELASGNIGLLSEALVKGLEALDTEHGERAILVINRRGSASVVLCRDCGEVQSCPECTRPLVYHASESALRCHICGSGAPMARRCASCDSPRIRFVGGGTERVEREVRQRFPRLRVGRLDRDVAARRGAATRVLDAFRDGELDVLVGTTLVTKGLDIPEVTLVGIVSADISLNLPDERAAERTWQLLVQAIGRAGRGDRPGIGIIQTYQPEHPAVVAAASGNADAFYDAELAGRRLFGAPPFGRLVKLIVGDEDEAAAEKEARRLADVLRARSKEQGSGIAVIGPARAFVPRRAGRWRWHVILRGPSPTALLTDAELTNRRLSIDVDPESLL